MIKGKVDLREAVDKRHFLIAPVDDITRAQIAALVITLGALLDFEPSECVTLETNGVADVNDLDGNSTMTVLHLIAPL